MSFTCAKCGAKVPAEKIQAHLKIEHDIEADFQEWPDGSPVIVDSTLSPSDFELEEKK